MIFVYQVIAAFFGTAAFSVLFNAPRKEWIRCGLTGAAGWLVYLLINQSQSAPVSTFIAVLFITIAARILAHDRKVPANIFLIPGIFPVVPGSGIYDTIYYILMNDLNKGIEKGMLTLKICGAIVLGIIVIFALPVKPFQILVQAVKHRSHNK